MCQTNKEIGDPTAKLDKNGQWLTVIFISATNIPTYLYGKAIMIPYHHNDSMPWIGNLHKTFDLTVHQFISVLFMFTPAVVLVLLNCQLSNPYLQ